MTGRLKLDDMLTHVSLQHMFLISSSYLSFTDCHVSLFHCIMFTTVLLCLPTTSSCHPLLWITSLFLAIQLHFTMPNNAHGPWFICSSITIMCVNAGGDRCHLKQWVFCQFIDCMHLTNIFYYTYSLNAVWLHPHTNMPRQKKTVLGNGALQTTFQVEG